MSSVIRILIVLGVVVGCCSGIYMSGRYIWLSDEIATIQALMEGAEQNESIIQKFKTNVNDIENADIIIKEIQSCYEKYNLVNITMMNMVEDKRGHAFWCAVLFFIFSAIFGVTAIHIQKKTKLSINGADKEKEAY